jgi:predicted transcriptional regulator
VSEVPKAREAGEAPESRGAPERRDGREPREGHEGREPRESDDGREGREPGEVREGGVPRDSPMGRDSAAVRQFIQRFASLLADAGMPRMPARIFVALLTADTSRLTAEELAGLLTVSPAAVSGGVRYLIQVGLVSRETEPGSRRHVYVLPDNVWHEVLRVRDGIMMRWADAMRGGAEVLGAGTPAGTRLAESAMYFEFVSKELPLLLGRWEDYKAAHRD